MYCRVNSQAMTTRAILNFHKAMWLTLYCLYLKYNVGVYKDKDSSVWDVFSK